MAIPLQWTRLSSFSNCRRKRTISPQSRYHENRFRPSRSCSTLGSLRQNAYKWARSCWIVLKFKNTNPSHHPVCVQELLPIVMVMQSEKVLLYRKCQVDCSVIWKNPPQWVGLFVETSLENTFWNWTAVPKRNEKLSLLHFWSTASVQFRKSIADDLPSARGWIPSLWELTSKEP